MDTKSIDEISAALEILADSYPNFKLCLIMAQPCAEHHGAHVDLATCGHSDICAMINDALTRDTNIAEPSPTVN